MPKIILHFVAFLFTISTFSQKANLAGVIIDTDKIPIQNTVVALLTPKIQFYTDLQDLIKKEILNLKISKLVRIFL